VIVVLPHDLLRLFELAVTRQGGRERQLRMGPLGLPCTACRASATASA
jgi:hypothetical protein